MTQHIKGNQGMTLVEVLAAFSILSLLLLLVSSIHFFGQKNFMDQTSWVEKQGSVRVAMNQITKSHSQCRECPRFRRNANH